MKVTALVLTAALAAVSASPASSQTTRSPFGEVAHHVVSVDGVRFHYVTAGSGEPVVLIPGWPESWIAWRKVIPLLVKAGRQVYVLDPRGVGDTDKPEGGYDLDTAARDLHGFLAAVGLSRDAGVDVVGHDVGTWIALADAEVYPGDVQRLVLTESAIPGISPPGPAGIPSEAVNLKSWQFAFNRLVDLPEILVQGHERDYLTWLFETKSTRNYAIEPAALDEYVRIFSEPGAARASFEWYRAALSAEGLAQAKDRAGRRLTMPVLALGGSDGVGDALHATITTLGDHVTGGAIGKGCGHFLPEECPDDLTAAIFAFWRATRPRNPKERSRPVTASGNSSRWLTNRVRLTICAQFLGMVSPSKQPGKGAAGSPMAPSLAGWPGATSHCRRAQEPLAIRNPSSPADPKTEFNSCSRTR